MQTSHILALCSVLSLSACANMGAGYDPILDGAPTAMFASDQQACATLAGNQKQLNQETWGAAAAGGLLGAAVADDDGEAALAGLVVGGIAGYIGGVFEAKEKRESIVRECLKGRGHKVIG